MAKSSTWLYPHYEFDTDHTIRRYDHPDHEGVIVAFCPNPEDTGKIVQALSFHVEHDAMVGLLNGTHDVLRDIRERLDRAGAIPPRT